MGTPSIGVGCDVEVFGLDHRFQPIADVIPISTRISLRMRAGAHPDTSCIATYTISTSLNPRVAAPICGPFLPTFDDRFLAG
jgi:hypothetical protein